LLRHQILGRNGAYEILRFLYIHPNLTQEEVISYLESDALPKEEIERRIRELKEVWFVEQPPRSDFLRITEDGTEAYLLAKVINGDTLESVVNQLSSLRYTRFSLITEDITGCFIDILKSIQDLKEIYICSPWIRLTNRHLSDLAKVLENVRVRVITRPPPIEPAPWKDQVLKTLNWLRERGAELVGHPAVHTKLYIAIGRDYRVAIFGSENLTSAKNIELGIRVSEDGIISKLLLYWLDIYNECKVIEEEELVA